MVEDSAWESAQTEEAEAVSKRPTDNKVDEIVFMLLLFDFLFIVLMSVSSNVSMKNEMIVHPFTQLEAGFNLPFT